MKFRAYIKDDGGFILLRFKWENDNFCLTHPCKNKGKCIQDIRRCVCSSQWKGRRCEIPVKCFRNVLHVKYSKKLETVAKKIKFNKYTVKAFYGCYRG